VLFIIGMVAAGYSSADGTLTALTTTLCYDFLGFERRADDKSTVKMRRWVHVGFALLYLVVILAFRPFHRQSLIDTLFDIAGFTYGPLLGLYTFGLFTKHKVRDRWVPVVAVVAPVVSYVLKRYAPEWFGYHFGFEILLINGLLTFVGLLAIRQKHGSVVEEKTNNKVE
jgi:Na+/proline symporter